MLPCSVDVSSLRAHRLSPGACQVADSVCMCEGGEVQELASKEISMTMSGEFGLHKTAQARFWPWLEPFCRSKHSQHFEWFPARSTAVRALRFEERICIELMTSGRKFKASREGWT